MTPKASGDLVPSCLPSPAVGPSPLPTLQANNTGLYSAAGPWQSQTLRDSRDSQGPRSLRGTLFLLPLGLEGADPPSKLQPVICKGSTS